jgi:hypothetical protein
MKSLKLVLLACVCWAYSSTQVFGVVGYYFYPFQPGANLFGNSLSNTDNHLDSIFQTAPVGTTVALWDPIALQYTTASAFNGTSWSINYNMTPGIGGLLNTSILFTNIFAGTVLTGPGPGDIPPPIPPVRQPGYYLIGSDFPVNGRSFQDVIGRAPREGEFVTSLNEFTQGYSTTHFQGGVWDNGAPTLDIGDAAFFNLVPIPEPNSLVLLSLGIATFGWRRLRNRS